MVVSGAIGVPLAFTSVKPSPTSSGLIVTGVEPLLVMGMATGVAPTDTTGCGDVTAACLLRLRLLRLLLRWAGVRASASSVPQNMLKAPAATVAPARFMARERVMGCSASPSKGTGRSLSFLFISIAFPFASDRLEPRSRGVDGRRSYLFARKLGTYLVEPPFGSPAASHAWEARGRCVPASRRVCLCRGAADAAIPLLTTHGCYAMRARSATPGGRQTCYPTQMKQQRKPFVTRPQPFRCCGRLRSAPNFLEPPQSEVRRRPPTALGG